MGIFRHGEIIHVSKPYVFALSHNERGIRCDFCFKAANQILNSAVRRCSICKIVFFCDVSCQRSAWNAFHKEECLKLASIPPENAPTETFVFFTRLALKTFRANRIEETDEVLGKIRSFNDLEAHTEEILNDLKRKEQFFFLERFLKGFFPDLHCEKQDLMLVFGKMIVNTYTICNSEGQAIGTGLYLGASIFNHSCDPNAIPTFRGTTLYVRAIKDISYQSTDDICISYVDPLDSTNARQLSLKEQYYFTCTCSSCLNMEQESLKTEVQIEQEASVFVTVISPFLEEAFSKRAQMELEEKQTLYNKCKNYLDQQKQILGARNVFRIRLLELLFDLCIDLALWEEALLTAEPLLEIYKLFYNKYYLTVGIHLFKVGKIHNFLGQLADAEGRLLESRNVLSVCRGENDDIIEELDCLIFQCRSEMNATSGSPSLCIKE